MQIACVLKSGPEYKPEHVYALADSILSHNPDTNIKCLTDLKLQHPRITTEPLVHKWPGWWSKIELFRPGVFEGPTMYLDIDTVVVGRLPAIGDRFTMLQDVYQREGLGSGVMSWVDTPNYLYDAFLVKPARHMRTYRTRGKWGDQGFIKDHLQENPAIFGRECRSYKVHCKHGIPDKTKVVFFHGKPRPWQVSLKWRTA